MRKSNERRSLSRVRRLALPLVLLSLSACAQTTRPAAEPDVAKVNPSVASMYSAIDDGGNLVPAVDAAKIESKNVRQVVDYQTKEPPGTIVVDPYARFLYLVMENGKAMRYGVGVAKAGLEFVGEADIARKAQWPGWTPTQDMIKRDPERYEPLAKGLPGGLKNPLGARALYLYKGGQDTLYRIHGTNEPWSIGKSVSSGCIRMLNQDIIDLHRRVPKGSRVVVLGPEQSGKGEI
ncbi:MAG: L,D-transpeptidase [Alphaproteobacteria bacterium]|nr:L,D-transpeptidase [Rhizobiaceae bacterium]MBU3963888.1 L,D-transpeptidase [Alphaproteobacteria bacterium]MBU4051595.1 L,D-transpeptidase [Alphaproteobacteria bacterium]MBU4087120.1 L,D-transpeptidase [Alphaproteobacteria bacterium]MBU4156350.1 L,D-transpeptidase [Alphaproteobacteria bacterium]